jgi:hypothetical protein
LMLLFEVPNREEAPPRGLNPHSNLQFDPTP